MDTPQKEDPYAALSVPNDASPATIRSAYKKLMLQCHPDKVRDEALRAEKQAMFDRVQRAYELLNDSRKRRKYDEEVAKEKEAATRKAEKEKEKAERRSKKSTREPSARERSSTRERSKTRDTRERERDREPPRAERTEHRDPTREPRRKTEEELNEMEEKLKREYRRTSTFPQANGHAHHEHRETHRRDSHDPRDYRESRDRETRERETRDREAREARERESRDPPSEKTFPRPSNTGARYAQPSSSPVEEPAIPRQSQSRKPSASYPSAHPAAPPNASYPSAHTSAHHSAHHSASHSYPSTGSMPGSMPGGFPGTVPGGYPGSYPTNGYTQEPSNYSSRPQPPPPHPNATLEERESYKAQLAEENALLEAVRQKTRLEEEAKARKHRSNSHGSDSKASKEVPSPEIHKSGTSDEKRRERKAKRDAERRSDEHLSASNATGRPTDIPNGRRRGSSSVSKDDFMPGGSSAYGPAPPPHMFAAASLPTGHTYPTHGSPTGGYPTTARPQRRHSVSSPSMEKMQARGMRASPTVPARTSTHPSPMMGTHTAPMSVPPAVVPPAMQHQDSGYSSPSSPNDSTPPMSFPKKQVPVVASHNPSGSPTLSGSYKTYTICIPDNGEINHNQTATVEIPTDLPNNSTLYYTPTPQGLKLNHRLPAPGEGVPGAPSSPTATPIATPTSNYSTASQSQHSQYSQSNQSQSAKSNSPNSARSVPRRSNTINMGSPHLGLPAGGFEFSGYQGMGKNAVSPGLSRASTSYSSHSGHSAHSGSTVRPGFVPPMQGSLRREETWS